MTSEIIILCIAAFAAGFIDAIVGGGGLVQTPATIVTLPNHPLATVLGTTKIPSFFGAAIAAVQYSLKVKINWKLLVVMCSFALLAAYAGSKTVATVSNTFMKPILFMVLIAVAIYTYTKKDFGQSVRTTVGKKNNIAYCLLFAVIIGFYDGFIGPGAGSFMVLFFISIMGYDFLKASAHSKILNVSTNIGSIIYFSGSANILYHYAIPMAVFNFAGSLFGARLAILKGNKFIRIFFLIVVIGTIVRFGYDIFFRKN